MTTANKLSVITIGAAITAAALSGVAIEQSRHSDNRKKIDAAIQQSAISGEMFGFREAMRCVANAKETGPLQQRFVDALDKKGKRLLERHCPGMLPKVQQ